MPELPEVEIHARNLRDWLSGRTIRSAEVLDARLGDDLAERLAVAVVGHSVEGVRRVAKYLFIDLEGGHTMVAHLRMTGRFVRDVYLPITLPKATRLAIVIHTGERVRFEDSRRFGRIWVVLTSEAMRLPELAHLGPDALLDPITPERLAEAAGRTRRPIKVLLMDQTLLGGLGNICVIELLFRAGIAPDTPSNALTERHLQALAQDIPVYLQWAIDAQSRRELIYLGEKGAENVFPIYRRAGEPCPRCSTPIRYGAVAGRGTYWCPECQKASG